MNWLEADDETRQGGFADEDIKLSITALYYHMVAVDGVVSALEMQRLRAVLSERFHLNVEQLDALTKQGQEVDSSSPGLFPFAFILNRELSESDRRQVFEQMDALARADGVVHSLEADLLSQMKAMLRLED